MCGISALLGYRPIQKEICNAQHAQNRRGEDTAGYIGYNTLEGKLDEPIRGIGLASEVAQEFSVHKRPYRAMLGQVRYPTTGSTKDEDRIRDAQH